MKYSTNQFTKVTGVTVDALRYYEKNKICIPEKDDRNNYRQYSNQDAIKVMMTKLYRNLEVPVSDICLKINGHIEDAHIDEASFIANKINNIEFEIRRLELLKERLAETEKFLGEVDALNPVVEIVELPSIYKVKSNIKCSKTETLIRDLIDFFPFSVPSLTIRRKDLMTPSDQPLSVQLGIHITEEFAKKLNVHTNPIMEYYPEGLGMCCNLWVKDISGLTFEKLKPILEQITAQGYELSEDISVKVISINQIAGEIMYLTMLCAKVKAV